MAPIPSSNDADYAEQHTLVCATDQDTGLDTTALTPLAERIRAAFDSAETTDRIEQSFLTPLPDEDYPLAY
ncbi:hypothetical protein [Nocardia pneumoniae]|uniref:hypothetical protein n=1 Tax=Nocardia pneumoniae TaxID=228601 RepID=UPI0002FE8F8E|nr:hypothetical protein [Nocardia pneumoniae]